jgi:hypothetical protein
MSAPNEGRQSPDPERQPGKQLQEPPAMKPNEQGAEPEEGAQQASKGQLEGLSSNPTHPLEKAAHEKTSKQ